MLQLELLTSQSFFLVFFIILLSTEYAFYDAFYGSKWSNFLGILLIFWPWVLKSAFASLVWHGRPNAIAKDFWRLAKSWPQSDWHLGRLRIFRLRWDVMFFFVPRLEKKGFRKKFGPNNFKGRKWSIQCQLRRQSIRTFGKQHLCNPSQEESRKLPSL